MAEDPVRYQDNLDGIAAEHLEGGFFEGWPNPPSPTTHLKLLHGSYMVRLAVAQRTGQVVGFVNAISDGVLSAYLPLLEVLPAYRGRGIGSALMRRMMQGLAGLYMVDLTSTAGKEGFYQQLGMTPASSMILRNYAMQSGERPR